MLVVEVSWIISELVVPNSSRSFSFSKANVSVLGLLTSICHSLSMYVLLLTSENEHLWTGCDQRFRPNSPNPNILSLTPSLNLSLTLTLTLFLTPTYRHSASWDSASWEVTVTNTDERKQALRALCIGCCISNCMVANCTMSPLHLTPVFLHRGLLKPGKICHSQWSAVAVEIS